MEWELLPSGKHRKCLLLQQLCSYGCAGIAAGADPDQQYPQAASYLLLLANAANAWNICIQHAYHLVWYCSSIWFLTLAPRSQTLQFIAMGQPDMKRHLCYWHNSEEILQEFTERFGFWQKKRTESHQPVSEAMCQCYKQDSGMHHLLKVKLAWNAVPSGVNRGPFSKVSRRYIVTYRKYNCWPMATICMHQHHNIIFAS